MNVLCSAPPDPDDENEMEKLGWVLLSFLLVILGIMVTGARW